MRNHQIFLFTSDRNEGWGAVLNESMSNGCAVVASDLIGSAPFLIEDGVNGLLFKSENVDSLYAKVKMLLDNPTLTENMAENAILTMRNTWSPKIAAERFIKLASNLSNGEDTPFENGPCSKAFPCVIK